MRKREMATPMKVTRAMLKAIKRMSRDATLTAASDSGGFVPLRDGMTLQIMVQAIRRDKDGAPPASPGGCA